MTERTINVNVNNATAAQLRQFATTTLGLEIPPTSKAETILAKIRQTGYDADEIPVPAPGGAPADDADAPREPPRPVTASQRGPKPGYVRIHVMESEGRGGKDPVAVRVNGRAMLIPRGKDADVPYRYYVALKHAVKNHYDTDDNGKMIPIARQVPNYPFSVLAGLEEAEAHHKAQAARDKPKRAA